MEGIKRLLVRFQQIRAENDATLDLRTFNNFDTCPFSVSVCFDTQPFIRKSGETIIIANVKSIGQKYI